MWKPRVSTCACCLVSWPTPSSTATTWRSPASCSPTLSSIRPPRWRTAPPWHSGSTTWRRGPPHVGTPWKGRPLLGCTTTTPPLHLPWPPQDPPPRPRRPTPPPRATFTPCTTTSAMARTTGSTAGRAHGTLGWVEAGIISSSRAARTATSSSTLRPLCQQPSTRWELAEAATPVSQCPCILKVPCVNFALILILTARAFKKKNWEEGGRGTQVWLRGPL